VELVALDTSPGCATDRGGMPSPACSGLTGTSRARAALGESALAGAGGERRASGAWAANAGAMSITQNKPNPANEMGVSTVLRFKGVASGVGSFLLPRLTVGFA
jgi:hypothetical protein